MTGSPCPPTRSRSTVTLAVSAAAVAVTIAVLLTFGAAPTASAASTQTAASPAAGTPAWAGNHANPYGGTDYYIDATGGNDTNSGTSPSSAWKSLVKATATTFSPGDRILLKAGETWSNSQLWPKGSGTVDKPIVLDAYGDPAARRPYIATNGVVPSPFNTDGTKNPDTVGLTGAVNLRNQQHWLIGNLEISNDDNFAVNITTGTYVRDGISVSINADKFAAGDSTIMDGITISNVYVHNLDGPSTWQKIYYAGVDFQVFGQKQHGDYGTGGYYFKNIRIENNTFKNVELNAIQFGFNWFGDQVGQTDTAGKYHEGWEQLWVRTQDLYSRDVYIGHNYAESIGQGAYQFADTKNLVAEYNEANGWLQRYDGVSAGLYLWASADSVMRFNEIYGGPANQYDATPWDLEFTNFNVVYEHNYSHDNLGGWMSYMGNSSNSIARYNLSVNDNGVIWKNMLSTNYSPTYVLNNVFVYDGAKLASFHDEILKDRVYFANNVFYNTSTTTTTTWYQKPGALDKAVFSNNAFYEASGIYSPNQPADPHAVIGDPQFVGNPAAYAKNGGVDNIRQSASLFALKATSPLIDAGRFNPRIGTEDFFGGALYYGNGVDIGINEVHQGALVANPVDTNPIENTGVDTRIDLAKGKPATASSTHPYNNYQFNATNLTDGDPTTRWAAADDATYPITLDINFGADTTFNEVDLSEFIDSGTNPRVQNYQLQRWDSTTNQWTTFSTRTDGIGTRRIVNDFGIITTAKLRVLLTSLEPGEIYSPTLTGISVYNNAPTQTNPSVSPTAAVMDINTAIAGTPANTPTFTVTLNGDAVIGLRYVEPSGAIVGSLKPAEFTRTDTSTTTTLSLTAAFAAPKQLGPSGVIIEYQSGKTQRVTVEILDTTALVAAIHDADATPPTNSATYDALAAALTNAKALLAKANRNTVATGNTSITSTDISAATTTLQSALAAYIPPTTGPSPTPSITPTTSPSTGSIPTRSTTPSSTAASVIDVLARTGTDPEGALITAVILLSVGLACTTLVMLRRRRTSRHR